jgi:hypothetical protein
MVDAWGGSHEMPQRAFEHMIHKYIAHARGLRQVQPHGAGAATWAGCGAR